MEKDNNILDVLLLSEELIKEPSVTPDAANCFNIIESYLKKLGFEVYRETFGDDIHPATENLYASFGAVAPNVCFAGHIDVVPPGDDALWDTPPFEPQIKDGWLYGRGAEDMKGAVAAMLSSVSEFIAHHNELNGSISFLLTADEEGDGWGGTKKMLHWMEENNKKIDYCLVGEPTNPNYFGEMCKIGRRGSLLCSLLVEGKQGHIAYPHLAQNPITHLVNILHNLKNTKIDNGSEFFPASNLEVTSVDVGNTTHNLIPSTAEAHFNIRFNDLYNGKTIEEWVRKRCEEACEGVNYQLNMRISGESFLTSPGILSNAIQKSVAKVTGHTPELSTTGGTSDARFIKDYCQVAEFGTTGFTPHKVNERVETEVLYKLHDVYVEFLKEMLINQ